MMYRKYGISRTVMRCVYWWMYHTWQKT